MGIGDWGLGIGDWGLGIGLKYGVVPYLATAPLHLSGRGDVSRQPHSRDAKAICSKCGGYC